MSNERTSHDHHNDHLSTGVDNRRNNRSVDPGPYGERPAGHVGRTVRLQVWILCTLLTLVVTLIFFLIDKIRG